MVDGVCMEIVLDKNSLKKLIYLGNFDDESRENVCHICFREKPLTREHVPPKSAFNNCTGLWDHLAIKKKHGSGRVQFHGGFWVKTLCRECNTSICSTYARNYVEFIHSLVAAPVLFDSSGEAKLLRVRGDTLYLAKEIATMILAVEPLSFAKHHERLREFVLNRELAIRPDFTVLAFLVPNRPGASTITRYHGRVDTYAPNHGFMGGEISGYPFGFVYTNKIGKGYYPEKFTDITQWFSNSGSFERNNSVMKFYTRITGVDSIQCGLGKPRKRPQIDYY